MAATSRPNQLTKFMCAIYAPDMTVERLKAMNTEAVAKHYRIPIERVEFERTHALKMRGAM